MTFSDPHKALRHHVTGAVERGEKEAISEVTPYEVRVTIQIEAESVERAKEEVRKIMRIATHLPHEVFEAHELD